MISSRYDKSSINFLVRTFRNEEKRRKKVNFRETNNDETRLARGTVVFTVSFVWSIEQILSFSTWGIFPPLLDSI